MNQQPQNKAFIVAYSNAMLGAKKIEALLDRFMSDQKLKEHILFFDGIFPDYEVAFDEMTAEGDRVVVLALQYGLFERILPRDERIFIPAAHFL